MIYQIEKRSVLYNIYLKEMLNNSILAVEIRNLCIFNNAEQKKCKYSAKVLTQNTENGPICHLRITELKDGDTKYKVNTTIDPPEVDPTCLSITPEEYRKANIHNFLLDNVKEKMGKHKLKYSYFWIGQNLYVEIAEEDWLTFHLGFKCNIHRIKGKEEKLEEIRNLIDEIDGIDFGF